MPLSYKRDVVPLFTLIRSLATHPKSALRSSWSWVSDNPNRPLSTRILSFNLQAIPHLQIPIGNLRHSQKEAGLKNLKSLALVLPPPQKREQKKTLGPTCRQKLYPRANNKDLHLRRSPKRRRPLRSKPIATQASKLHPLPGMRVPKREDGRSRWTDCLITHHQVWSQTWMTHSSTAW